MQIVFVMGIPEVKSLRLRLLGLECIARPGISKKKP